jgi:hypothetical protein
LASVALRNYAPAHVVTAYSLGQQLILTAWDVVLGFVLLWSTIGWSPPGRGQPCTANRGGRVRVFTRHDSVCAPMQAQCCCADDPTMTLGAEIRHLDDIAASLRAMASHAIA